MRSSSENIDEWRTAPAVIDETVRIVKIFLEKNPEEIKKVSPTGATPGKAGVITIAKFLGWKESRILYSLERLKLIWKKIQKS